jgi:hypothetical protein
MQTYPTKLDREPNNWNNCCRNCKNNLKDSPRKKKIPRISYKKNKKLSPTAKSSIKISKTDSTVKPTRTTTKNPAPSPTWKPNVIYPLSSTQLNRYRQLTNQQQVKFRITTRLDQWRINSSQGSLRQKKQINRHCPGLNHQWSHQCQKKSTNNEHQTRLNQHQNLTR